MAHGAGVWEHRVSKMHILHAMPQDQDRRTDARLLRSPHRRHLPLHGRLAAAAFAVGAALLLSACATKVPLPPMTPYPPAPGTPGAGAAQVPGMPPGAAGVAQPGVVTTQPVVPGATVPGTPAPPVQPRFLRPANGAVLARFDGNDNKGIDIGGRLGDPVIASAAGRVVYAGDELRNYGNLVILDHGNDFLTAYAFNRIILVQERQTVTQGQKIGEIGRNAEGTALLHFEIRKGGQPVDPEPYLAGMMP